MQVTSRVVGAVVSGVAVLACFAAANASASPRDGGRP